MPNQSSIPLTFIHRIQADGVTVFYREAGRRMRPSCSSCMASPHHRFNTSIWGKNDPFFIPPGAEAYARDNPNAIVQFLDTGHFALETHLEEITGAMRQFLAKTTA